MNKSCYPSWIDEYAKARYKSSVYTTPATWGPIDSFFMPKYYQDDLAVKLRQVIQLLKKKNLDKKIIAQSYPTISSLRTGISFLLVDYYWTKEKNLAVFRDVLNFLVDLLQTAVQRDTFALNHNLIHNQQEITEILDQTFWKEADPGVAKLLGQLMASLASLVFGLYGDFYPQISNETYGPYDASKKFGKGMNLIVRDFPEIKPVKLWKNTNDYKHSRVQLFLIYRDVQYEMVFLGMHSHPKGDLIKGLKKYAVKIDDKWISSVDDLQSLTNYFTDLAVTQSQILEKMSLEDLKKKSVEWTWYQHKGLFDLVGMDWRPDEKTLEKVKNQKVPRRLESGKLPTWEQFCKSKHNDYSDLKDLFNGNS